jgi:hypothetical protein
MIFKPELKYKKILLKIVLLILLAGIVYLIWPLFFDNIKQNQDISLPIGYTVKSYVIEKVTELSCQKNSDCQTPGEYLVQSRCPFVSLCLKNKCAIVCPTYQDLSWTDAEKIINNCEIENMGQRHNRTVTLNLKDGRKLLTIEPKLDTIVDIADKLENKCGKIRVSTE